MEVTFYKGFVKRSNSTKRPTDGVVKEVTLKDKTSMRNPTFRVEDDGVGYDYCSVGTWYYYIKDKIYYPNKVIEYVCTLDVLASNKDAIASLNCYIDRCSQSSPDLLLNDEYNSKTSRSAVGICEVPLDVADYQTSGSVWNGYILTANGKNGVVAYYLTQSILNTLLAKLQDRSGSTEEQTYLNIANENFNSLIRVPYYIDSDGTTETISLGPVTFEGLTAWKIPLGKTRTKHYTVKTSAMPYPSSLIWSMPDSYVDFEPYTVGYLYLPFVGIVPLDLDIISVSKNIELTYNLDLWTGDILWEIGSYTKNNYMMISSYTGKCASTVPVSKYQNDALGKVSATYQMVGGALAVASTAAFAAAPVATMTQSYGALSDTLTGVNTYSQLSEGMVEGALNHVKSSIIHTSTCGNVSSMLGTNLGTKPIIYLYSNKPNFTDLTSPNNIYGMPFRKMGTIADITGDGKYIKTRGCNFVGGCFDTNTQTRALLDQGIYYE